MNFKIVRRTGVQHNPVLYVYTGEKYLGSLFFKDAESCSAFAALLTVGSEMVPSLGEVEFTDGPMFKPSVS